jgi:hypothetical protein
MPPAARLDAPRGAKAADGHRAHTSGASEGSVRSVSKTFHPWQVSGCANKSIFALHFLVAITTDLET